MDNDVNIDLMFHVPNFHVTHVFFALCARRERAWEVCESSAGEPVRCKLSDDISRRPVLAFALVLTGYMMP